MYKISIITPTYNSEKFIEQTILSVMEQSYKNYEHIVIDGGSTDKTLNIVSKYPHIKLMTGKDNGMYDALNKGIRIATGDIIGCLNSDDLYYSNTLEIVNNFFINNPATMVINGNCVFMNEQGQELFILRSPEYNMDNYLSVNNSIVFFPTVFWKKELHTKVGYFNDTFRIAADYDFYARIGKYYTIINTKKKLARFRLHQNSLSSTQQKLCTQEIIVIKNNLMDKNKVSYLFRGLYTKFIFYCVLNPHALWPTLKEKIMKLFPAD